MSRDKQDKGNKKQMQKCIDYKWKKQNKCNAQIPKKEEEVQSQI